MHYKIILRTTKILNSLSKKRIVQCNINCRVCFESQNQSLNQREQPPDGSNSGITADVTESALLDNKNPRINFSETL